MEHWSLLALFANGNFILSSANAILALSLFLYILAHNLSNPVARSFAALMGFVAIVYAGDAFLTKVDSQAGAIFWLRVQWIGIAFVPAAYLHFSDALLRTTNAFSWWRRAAVFLGYLISLAIFLVAVRTQYILSEEIFYSPWAAQFAAGPYFAVFTFYFVIVSAWGFLNILWARRRCLTSTSRRRMNYLLISFAAPGLGVFPYLILASVPPAFSPEIILFISLVGNVGIALMIVLMAYAVAYHGVFSPDRVVKRSLMQYLAQGPLLATLVIGLMLLFSGLAGLLGLPREIALAVAAVAGIILFQVFFSLAKSLVDILAYWEDRDEILWLRRLDDRLLTSNDLSQLLENIVTAACDLLRVRKGFVVAAAGSAWHLEAFSGPRTSIVAVLDNAKLNAAITALDPSRQVIAYDGFWLRPLRSEASGRVIGLLGIEARASEPDLTERERDLVDKLARQAELALEDRHVQQGIFAVLEELGAEIESIQRWRSTVRYTGSLASEAVVEKPSQSPDFVQWVRDALDHYWGGPKLRASPLLELNLVKDALGANDHNPTKALRTVLMQAIEAIKPDGQRSLTAREWVLYNILDLRFIQGRRIREIADRLAISESDLYRKQRVAIEEVAKILAAMEAQRAETAANQTEQA